MSPPPDPSPPPVPPPLVPAAAARVGLRRGGFTRQLAGRFGGPTDLLLSNRVHVLGFGRGALGLVLGGQLDGGGLRLGDRLGERLGGLELVGQVGAFDLEIGDQGVEIVGGRGPDAERDT